MWIEVSEKIFSLPLEDIATFIKIDIICLNFFPLQYTYIVF